MAVVTQGWEGQVAIVTGAGAGLGRAYALALAAQGVKVVVNDLGESAEQVAAEIAAAGGQAMAQRCSVTDFAAVQAMVSAVQQRWGRVDILIHNAGILRDKTFAKVSLEDFRLVMDVHLMGAVHCCKAVWPLMQEQQYGRIVLTTSSSGLYGNFGQSNYSAAKMALVGLMQTLALEGQRDHIHVNCIAPTAATAMTEGLLPQPMIDLLKPQAVVPAVIALVSGDAPTRTILSAGAGHVGAAHITMTQGCWIGEGEDAATQVIQSLPSITDRAGETVPPMGMAQAQHEMGFALRAKGGG